MFWECGNSIPKSTQIRYSNRNLVHVNMNIRAQICTSTTCVREERALLAVDGSPFCVPLHLHTGCRFTGIFTKSDSALTGWSPVTAPFSVLLLKPQGPESMSGSWGAIFLFHHWVEHPALSTLVRVSSSPGRLSLLSSPLGAGWGSLTLLHKSASLSHVTQVLGSWTLFFFPNT